MDPVLRGLFVAGSPKRVRIFGWISPQQCILWTSSSKGTIRLQWHSMVDGLPYIYRSSKPKWQRVKVIYQPANVEQVAEVHTAKGGGTLRLRHGVYFQHYKKASQGIAKTTGKDLLVRDSRLRDQYMERVRNAVQPLGEHSDNS
jgi:hypothetical protein